jgi:hypothetical protein
LARRCRASMCRLCSCMAPTIRPSRCQWPNAPRGDAGCPARAFENVGHLAQEEAPDRVASAEVLGFLTPRPGSGRIDMQKGGPFDARPSNLQTVRRRITPPASDQIGVEIRRIGVAAHTLGGHRAAQVLARLLLDEAGRVLNVGGEVLFGDLDARCVQGLKARRVTEIAESENSRPSGRRGSDRCACWADRPGHRPRRSRRCGRPRTGGTRLRRRPRHLLRPAHRHRPRRRTGALPLRRVQSCSSWVVSLRGMLTEHFK